MTEQEYLRNIAIINRSPTIPELPALSPEEQAELENFGKFDDEISRDIERRRRHIQRDSDLQNAYNDKLTDEQVAKHYNSFQPDPNYHVEVVAEELETTWSKVKRWFKQLF